PMLGRRLQVAAKTHPYEFTYVNIAAEIVCNILTAEQIAAIPTILIPEQLLTLNILLLSNMYCHIIKYLSRCDCKRLRAVCVSMHETWKLHYASSGNVLVNYYRWEYSEHGQIDKKEGVYTSPLSRQQCTNMRDGNICKWCRLSSPIPAYV